MPLMADIKNKHNKNYMYMKKKSGFVLRNICGQNIIVAEGKENIDFSSIIAMNETAAFLWERIADNAFTPSVMADMLVQEYDTDYATALKDAKDLTNKWIEAGIIEN